jgi:L-lactate utilization protein LutB
MVDENTMVVKSMVKKKKVVPFHIAHNYEKFIHNGITFWARDKKDADKYVKKISK